MLYSSWKSGQNGADEGMGHSGGEGQQSAGPDAILAIASGFMAAKYLFAASEVGIFEALERGSATRDEVAERTRLPSRTAHILVEAMVKLGMLVRDGDAYKNAPAAESFLSGRPGPDLRPVLKFWDRISYPAWQGLAASVRSGRASTAGSAPSEEEQQIFALGVEALTAGPAHADEGLRL